MTWIKARTEDEDRLVNESAIKYLRPHGANTIIVFTDGDQMTVKGSSPEEVLHDTEWGQKVDALGAWQAQLDDRERELNVWEQTLARDAVADGSGEETVSDE